MLSLGLLLAATAVTTAARAEWVWVDDYLLYDRDSAAYDPNDDILAVYVDDFDYGDFWLYLRCGSLVTWFDEPAPGRWDALEPEFYPLRDTLCAQRGTLPFRDF